VSNIARILLLAGTASLLYAGEANAAAKGTCYKESNCQTSIATDVTKTTCKKQKSAYGWIETGSDTCEKW
jgi:hypothetical protein